jgi:hypothetical protein
VSRAIGLVTACVDTDEALESMVADAREAGVDLDQGSGPATRLQPLGQ